MTATDSSWRRAAFRLLALSGAVALALLVGEGILRLRAALDGAPEAAELGWVREPAPPPFGGDCATQAEQAELGDILWPTEDLDMVYGLIPGLDTCFRGVRVQTDDAGFRGTAGYEVPKPPGVSRVLLLGDSQAFGWGVTEMQTVGARLRESLERHARGPVEVINAAVPGYNSFQQAALLERTGMAHEPDCVLVLFTSNDLALPFFLLKDVAVPARSGSLLFARARQLTGSKRWFDFASEDLIGYVEETEIERVPEGYRHMVGIDGYRAAWTRMLRVAGKVPVINVGDLGEVRPDLAGAIERVLEDGEIAHLPLSWPKGKRFQLDPGSDPHPTPAAHRTLARQLGRELTARGLCLERPSIAPPADREPSSSPPSR